MFNKKKDKKQEQEQVKRPVIENTENSVTGTKKVSDFNAGIRTVKDMLAPSGVSVIDPKTLMVGNKYVRNFVMQGYPKISYVGWLNNLYNYHGDMDVMVKFEPLDDRQAVDQLTKQLTGYMSQLDIEMEKGSVRNISKYQNKIREIEQQRTLIEQNQTSLLQCTILGNLMADTKEELDRFSGLLENKTKGQRMDFVPTQLRMVEGFKATLPVLANGFKDKRRNFDVSAATGCFPFYNSEISDPDGVLLGYNIQTGSPALLNVFNDKMTANTNMACFGMAGSGKSYFVSLLTGRSTLCGVHTAIVDPEGEYHNITRELGGMTIKIGSKSADGSNINMFDIDEEQEIDDNGNFTGKVVVNLKEKISDILGILCVMANNINEGQKSALAEILQALYYKFGISENPESLYTSSKYDPSTGEFHKNGVKKKMPQFTDFHNLMCDMLPSFPELKALEKQLRIFKKGGIYDIFDCQSSINLSDMKTIPIINFDVKELDSSASILRPIGMYIALTFIWDKFVKKNPGIRKRVVVDEAWMFLNKNMPGHEFTAAFLETLARRIRKRKAGLLVASQNFSEFLNCSEGESVVKNSPYVIFLKQSETDLDNLQETFRLTDGERMFVTQAKTGMLLLKTQTGSYPIKTYSFPFEHEILTRKNF